MAERDRTQPSRVTRDAEAREAQHPADAGDAPTSDEEAAADEHADIAPEVSEHYREMTERGAHQEGEGRVP